MVVFLAGLRASVGVIFFWIPWQGDSTSRKWSSVPIAYQVLNRHRSTSSSDIDAVAVCWMWLGEKEASQDMRFGHVTRPFLCAISRTQSSSFGDLSLHLPFTT